MIPNELARLQALIQYYLHSNVVDEKVEKEKKQLEETVKAFNEKLEELKNEMVTYGN